MDVVVSTDTGHFKGLLTNIPGSGFGKLTTALYHHDAGDSNVSKNAGRAHTREAGTFLTHVAQEYHLLANKTAFVHEDVWAHNPVWPLWLACLREDASYASLSPVWFDTAPGNGGQLANALWVGGTNRTSNVPWSCCFLTVQSRAALHAVPRSVYVKARSMLELGAGNLVRATPFDLENLANMLQRPVRHDWLHPCVSYRCEEKRCGRLVRFSRLKGPFTHGIPIDGPGWPLQEWQQRSCGVVDIGRPERLQLSSVEEVLVVRCEAASLGINRSGSSEVMQSLADISNRRGCRPSAKFRAWMGEVSKAYVEGYRGHNMTVPSAKIAVFALKGAMCTGLVRCWQACCAECSRRVGWCVAWEWQLSGTCSLSSRPPTVAAHPSHERVVGRLPWL